MEPTPRFASWYERATVDSLHFKKPERAACLEVTALISADHTQLLGEVTCVLVPAVDKLLVVKVAYDIHPAYLGFVGSRRNALLDRVHNICARHWRQYSTLDLFLEPPLF